MRSLILIFVLVLSACASKKFLVEPLAGDGNNWMLKVFHVKCEDDAKVCKANVKKEVRARGNQVCGGKPFRVVNCEMKHGGSGDVDAYCTIRCGEKPVTVEKKSEAPKASEAPAAEPAPKAAEPESKPTDEK